MENTHIKTWFNEWDLADKEYTASELYADYKNKKANGFCISLIHFSKQLAIFARANKLITRSKNGKTLYYNELYKADAHPPISDALTV